MKKGFTLVEMSIVLVIIGVLIGLTVRGKQLIDAAKLRSDLNKIRNIQIAVASYMADNNGLFPDNFNGNDLDTSISPYDYVMSTATQALSLTQVGVDTMYSKINSGSDIAIVIGPDTGGSTAFSRSNIILGCRVDAIIDDKNASTEYARLYLSGGTSTTLNITIEATDCADVTSRYRMTGYAILVY